MRAPLSWANGLPRTCTIGGEAPLTARSAVAPSATMTRGVSALISAVSQTLQASIWRSCGRLCSRRLPRGSQLKCFTALVMNAYARGICA
jgi:hypothetical protein